MLDIRRLRYFLSIARLGSMAAASRSLNVAQPSLSQHMAELEAAIGAPLFIRFARGVRLTEAGERLREHAERILAQIEDAEIDLLSFVRKQQGQRMLRIAILPSWSASLTPTIIAETAKRLPDVVLRIVELRNDDALKALDDDGVDLAVILTQRSRNLPEAIVEEPLFFVSDRALPASIAFKDLLDQTLILPPPGNQLRDVLDRAAQAHGMTLRPAMEIDGQDTIKRAVEAGVGGSIMSWNSISAECLAGKLTIARVIHPGLLRSVYLGLGKGIDPDLARSLFDILSHIARGSLGHSNAALSN